MMQQCRANCGMVKLMQPEMEMAGTSMTYLPVEDRRVLLEVYKFAGGRNTEWLAKEALGLAERY